jgi:PadR family transcriptional regulator PadR
MSHGNADESRIQPGELIPGTLEALILSAISTGPMHGYSVADWIHERSQNRLKVDEGALYPALHRLARRGLVTVKSGLSENNRRARYYYITMKGRKHLERERQRWTRLAVAVVFVLGDA